jgi:hypothetical protein
MNPSQVSLAKLYGEVIALDACEGRNAYKMSLVTFIVINGENRSRNIAYCLTETKDAEAFEWMFRVLKAAVEHGYYMRLKVVFTDRDAAMAKAIATVWPDVFHGDCIWHLVENIKKNLSKYFRGPRGEDLGDGGDEDRMGAFLDQFWETYRQGSPDTFDKAWERLLRRFPETIRYLTTQIYPCKEKWAWAWVGSRFTAGMRTTGRVESEHYVYKLLELGPGSNLLDLFEKLCDRSTQQQDYEFEDKYHVTGPKTSHD